MNKTPSVPVVLLLALTTTAATAAPPAVEERVGAEVRTPRARHARMGLELGAIFAVGNRWYWRDNGKPNEVDWQLPHGGGALEAKLGGFGGWRFDGNPYDINALGHPGFGMLTHFLARENGYGIGQAFAISTLASTTWEVFLEWREFGSLNDMAVTSTAGVPLGEAAYQIIDNIRDAHFELRGGGATVNGRGAGVLSVRGELDQIPTRGSGTFRGGRRVSFAAEATADDAGPAAYEGGAKSTIAGAYWNPGGDQLVAAISAEFDYRKVERRDHRDWDLLTAVAVGPSLDYRLHSDSGLTLGVGADLYVGFGMLRSQAYDRWRADHADDKMRNTLEGREHPYYFGVGAAMDPRINVSYGGLFAGAKLTGARFGSIDGADRDQEMIQKRIHLADKDANAELALGYGWGEWSVMLGGRLRQRDGKVAGVEDSAATRTMMLTVGVRR